MSYWFSPEYKEYLRNSGLTESQAYLMGEMTYGLNAEILLSQTFAITPTIRVLERKGLAALDKYGLKIGLTEKGKELALGYRTDWGWNAGANSTRTG